MTGRLAHLDPRANAEGRKQLRDRGCEWEASGGPLLPGVETSAGRATVAQRLGLH